MKQLPFLISTVVLSLLLWGCTPDKPLPPDVVTTPVQFYFNGKIAGNNVAYEAGKAGYYMKVNKVALPLVDGIVFHGKLCKTADSSRNALEIYFYPEGTGNLNAIRTFFSPSQLAIQAQPTAADSGRVQFDASSPANFGVSAYEWDFGDGSASTLKSPVHTFANPYQTYNVVLRRSGGGCSSEVSQKITPVRYACQAVHDFNYSTLNAQERNIQFSAAQALYWDFGDGSPVVFGQNPTHFYAAKGVFTVRTATDSLQPCRTFGARNIEVGNVGGCGVNFSFTQNLPSKPLLKIVYKDANGKVYGSDLIAQNPDALFQIAKEENYTEGSQPIKKLWLNMRCTLKAADGSTVELSTDKAVWGVGMP